MSISLAACSQNNKNKNMNEEITSENFVEKVLESVKHYNIEPTYWLQIDKDSNAELEIYVNDMPVFKAYDTSGYNIGQDINYMILQSGEQKIHYKIFSQKKETYVGIEIYTINNKNKKDIETIKKYEKTIQMPASGVYEEEIVFDALVPYENKGWSDGQDLRKLDKDRLQKAVVAYYQKMWDIYNDKYKKEKLFPLIVERERDCYR